MNYLTMDLDKFLNLIATIFGTLGAVYVMYGILAMSPHLIAEQSNSYWDFSIPLIETLCQQKADNVAGFTFVIAAFFVGGATILFVPERVRFFESKPTAAVLAAVIAASLFIALHFVSDRIYKHERFSVGQIKTAEYLEHIIKQGNLNASDTKSLESFARDLLGVEVYAGEKPDAFFQRVANIVGVTVPQNFGRHNDLHK